MPSILLNRCVHGAGLTTSEPELLGPLGNDQTLSLNDKSGIQAIMTHSTLDLWGGTTELFPDLFVLPRPGMGVDNRLWPSWSTSRSGASAGRSAP